MKESSRPLMIFIFMFIVSTFLYVANLVVYEALAGIFNVTRVGDLMLLGTALFVLSASFIVSTMIGMKYYNVFTRWYYLVSAVWIGLFTYLFFAAVVYGILLMFSFSLAVTLGKILVCGAVLVSVYGVLHARKIKVTSIKVALQNLPQTWKERSAVWISDVHLGQLYGSSYAKRIVEKVNALPHDIIFIGGDLYDGTGASDIKELVAPLGNFSGKFGTYFITGNHEEIGESTVFVEAVRAAGIRPLLDEVVEIEGMQIIGVDYRNSMHRNDFQNIISRLPIEASKPSILLKHEPKDIDVAREAGISLQLSGHTHQAQMWPLGYLAHFIYKGFSYGLKRSGDTQVYTSSGVGTWGPPMRVGTDCEVVHITFV